MVWPTLSITPIGPPDLRCRAASPSRGRLAQQILPRTKEPRFSQAVSLGGRERGVSLPPFHPMSCLLPGRPDIPNLSWATLQCPGGTFPQNPWGDCCTGSTGHSSELSSPPSFPPPPRHVQYFPDEEPAHDPHRWVTHQYVTTPPRHGWGPGGGAPAIRLRPRSCTSSGCSHPSPFLTRSSLY